MTSTRIGHPIQSTIVIQVGTHLNITVNCTFSRTHLKPRRFETLQDFSVGSGFYFSAISTIQEDIAQVFFYLKVKLSALQTDMICCILS